jgi:hypothetical protein
MRISDNRNVDICLLHAEEWCVCSSSCDSGRKLAEIIREYSFCGGRKLNGTEFPTNTSNWYGEIGTNRAKIIQLTPSVHGGVVNEPL